MLTSLSVVSFFKMSPSFLVLETAEDFSAWMHACGFDVKETALWLDLPLTLVSLYQRGEVKVPLRLKLKCQALFEKRTEKKHCSSRWFLKS